MRSAYLVLCTVALLGGLGGCIYEALRPSQEQSRAFLLAMGALFLAAAFGLTWYAITFPA